MWSETRSEGPDHDWSIRVVSEMTCDAEAFYVTEEYSASEAGEVFFEDSGENRIPRDLV